MTIYDTGCLSEDRRSLPQPYKEVQDVAFALVIITLVVCHGLALADKAKIGIGEIVY